MAEILIFNKDNTHVDPEMERRWCYKSGDMIVVMPDGWGWGREEVRPADKGGKFRLVKVPGIPPEVLQRRMQHQFGVRHDAPLEKPGSPFIRRTRLRCDAAHGSVLTWQDFLANIVDKARERDSS